MATRTIRESEEERLRRTILEFKREQITTSDTLDHLSRRLDRLEQKFHVETEARRKYRQLLQHTLQKLNKYLNQWL